jgi:polyisoprenoid-binding protein YceI
MIKALIFRPYVKYLFAFIIIFYWAEPLIVFAQTNYTIGEHSAMNLKGTSSIRNWAMSAEGITGAADFQISTGHEFLSIASFSVRVPVHNLKAESKSMEKDALKALKADTFPTIDFMLTSAHFKPSGVDHSLILLHGNLTMAGVTQHVTLKASAAFREDGSIVCTGELPLSFSDYGMTRPSFLFGSMKVNDAMMLNFNLILVK